MRTRADRHLGLPNISGTRDGRLVLHFDAIREVVGGDTDMALEMLGEEFSALIRDEGLTGPPIEIIVTGLAILEDARCAIEQQLGRQGTTVIWSHPYLTDAYDICAAVIPVCEPQPTPGDRAPMTPTKRLPAPRDPNSDCPF